MFNSTFVDKNYTLLSGNTNVMLIIRCYKVDFVDDQFLERLSSNPNILNC